jgi:hypothetical protein
MSEQRLAPSANPWCHKRLECHVLTKTPDVARVACLAPTRRGQAAVASD